MKIDKLKNKIICRGKEYPATQYNVDLYREYLLTNKYNKKTELMDRLSDVVLDI